MISVATLGPANTFSDRAAQIYLNSTNQQGKIRLLPTIRRAFLAALEECDMAVLAIENMVEGYVQPVLDLLLDHELKIMDEFTIPVDFSFAATVADRNAVKRIYAQFVTQGQCADFLESLNAVEIITTPSNMTSLEMILKGTPDEGALIPSYAIERTRFPLLVENVCDFPNNRTRFILIGRELLPWRRECEYKTSLVVVEGKDRPGMLSEILAAFSSRAINLVSIMSRPTKESLGKYHFFIDIEGHNEEPRIRVALEEIQRYNLVRMLGSYPKARA